MQVVIKNRVGTVARGLLVGLFLVLVAACGSESPDRGKAEVSSSDVSTETQGNAAAAVVAAAEETGTRVLMKTTLGDIELLLDHEKAPISVANFLAYADSGHYEGTIYHRVIAGFMVQGGGFDEGLQQKSTQNPIENEAKNGLSNVKYSIAMARTSVVNSATSQFFINVADNLNLDHSVANYGYAVFGRVVSGQDVVNKIEASQTGAAGRFRSDVPVETILIESVTRL